MNPNVRRRKQAKREWRGIYRQSRHNAGRTGRVKERTRRPRRGE